MLNDAPWRTAEKVKIAQAIARHIAKKNHKAQ
jgi:hypothetical protein